MATINVADSQPYIISLDDLDLQYMARSVYNTKNDVLPIWSRKSVDSYYEFEVIPDGKMPSVPLIENERTMCHICNIQVPIQFSKDHFESDKHKCFKKIAEAALQRVAKDINNYVEVTGGNVTKDSYCSACSEIVYNKNVHNSSSKHLKSVKFDEAIKALLNLYLDKNALDNFKGISLSPENDLTNINIKSSNKSENNVSAKTVNASGDKKETQVNAIAFETNRKGSDTKLKNLVQLNHVQSVAGPSKNGSTKPKIITEADDFKSYVVDMVKQYGLTKPKLDVIDDSVVIYSAKGETQKVSSEMFHGFATNNQGVFCKACHEQVTEDIYIHKRNKTHATNVLKPLDEHFTRQVDEDWYHCVVCNKLILGVDFHCNVDVDHKRNLGVTPKHTITPSQPKENEPKIKIVETRPSEDQTGETYCKSCNRYIDTHNFSAHLNSKKHKEQRISYANIVSNDKTEPIIPKIVTPDYMSVGANPNQTYCKICSVNVPSTTKNISEHINAAKHQGNFSNILDQNKLTSENNEYKCGVCSITTNNLLEHIKNETHVNNVSNFCFVCNVKVPSKGMAVHELGKPHRQKLLASVSTSDVQSIASNSTTTTVDIPEKKGMDEKVLRLKKWLTIRTTNEKELHCRICKSIIPNNIEHMTEHFEGKKHISKYNNFLTENSVKETFNGHECTICRVINIQDIFSHIQIYHKTGIEPKKDEVKAEFCKICEKTVAVLSEHEKEFSHEVKLYGLLKNNKIDDKVTEYYCNVCEIYFFKPILSVHIKGTVHLDKIKLADQAIQYNYCELCKDKVEINGHEDSLSHRSKEHILQKENRIKKQDNHFYCEPCEQTIFKFALLLHVGNKKHVTNLNKFNENMKVEYCGICESNIKEYEHEYSILHKVKLYNLLKHNKITTNSEQYYCDVCKQNVNKEKLTSHIADENHVNALSVHSVVTVNL